MLFISYKQPKRSQPRRVLTAEKFVRMLKLQLSQRKKALKIQDEYQNTVDAKNHMLKMILSTEKVNELNAIKASERESGHGKKLKLAYLENSTSYLLFLKGLLDYAEANSASQLFIGAIKRNIDSAQETVIRIREKEF